MPSTPAVNIALNIKGIVEEPDVRRIAEYEKADPQLISRGVDPIGFGLRSRADRMTTEEEWRRWQAGYRGMPVEVRTRVHIEGTGALK